MSDMKKLLKIVDKVEKPVTINESASLSVVSKVTTEGDIVNILKKVTSLSGLKTVTDEMVTQKTAPKPMFQTIADVGKYAESAATEYKKMIREWETDPDEEDIARDESLQSAIEMILKKSGVDPKVMYNKMPYDDAMALAQAIEKASGTNYAGGPDIDADQVMNWFEKHGLINDTSESIDEDLAKHGSPYDRGQADSYYGRRIKPHWVDYDAPPGPGRIKKLEKGTPEYDEYMRGYEDNEREGDKKDWGEGVEEWANSPEPKMGDVDDITMRTAGGMNRPKNMYKHSYRQGDNPMAMRESIMTEWKNVKPHK